MKPPKGNFPGRSETGSPVIWRFVVDYLNEGSFENHLAELIERLCKEKKYQEIEAVSTDSKKRQEPYRLYNIT